MASAQPVIKDGPPMAEVKNIFFKTGAKINYYTDEAEAEAVENETAFQQFNRGLECSNKHGCLLFSFANKFFLIRATDAAVGGSSNFEDLKKLEIVNDALTVAPNVIVLSCGEEYLAVDTVRGDSSWIIIFKLTDFINQGGSCRPFCEIRCSSSATVKVSGVSWNPGENMTNILAINTDDGALLLAKVNGPGSVELNRSTEKDIRCLCWSPKGKQLVIGKRNGFISQLKLDLSVAKQTPPPVPGAVPISILWTHTTQFLIVFERDGGIEFMQLDVTKGIAPTYSNSGDIFVSDPLHDKSSCYFVIISQWNLVLAMTNTSSDIVVLVKNSDGKESEQWILADIADNRRAAFLLDHYTRGVTVFYGSENPVKFSDVETYAPMPIVFLLSQRGCLMSYAIVNNAHSGSINAKVTLPIQDSIFSMSKSAPKSGSSSLAAVPSPAQVAPQLQPTTNPVLPTATLTFGGNNQMPLFQSSPNPPQSSLFKSNQPSPGITAATQSQGPAFSMQSQAKPQPQSTKLFSTQSQLNQSKVGSGQSGSGDLGLQQQHHLGTSTLPTSIDLAGLEKAVEEKRREMSLTTQKDSAPKGPSESFENDKQQQHNFVVSETRLFDHRLSEFKKLMDSKRKILTEMLKSSCSSMEKSVLTMLNSVEDFTGDMVSTTSAQKEEVDVLKERILNHFSQLEYAKSLVERSRDPKYLQHLRSRPLDPASQQRFDEICKIHNYLKNQVSECRRYFYEQNRKRDRPLDRTPSAQLIYMTLSNHSKIIRRLKSELDNIKERLGLGKQANLFDEAEFLAVCEASYSGAKKVSATSETNEDQDDISLNDLTAGISKVKLNRDSSRPDRRPVYFSNRKLLIVNKSMPEVTVFKVKAEKAAWTKTATTPRDVVKPKPLVMQQYAPISAVTKQDAPSKNLGSTFTVETSLRGMVNVLQPPDSLSSNVVKGKNEGTTKTIPSLKPITPSSSPQVFKASPQPPQPPHSQGFATMPIKAATVAISSSPTMQHPTLTGLLTSPFVSQHLAASEGKAQKISSITSTSTATTVTTTAPSSFGFPTFNISFGSPSGAGNKSLFGNATPVSFQPTSQAGADTAVATSIAQRSLIVPSSKPLPSPESTPNLKSSTVTSGGGSITSGKAQPTSSSPGLGVSSIPTHTSTAESTANISPAVSSNLKTSATPSPAGLFSSPASTQPISTVPSSLTFSGFGTALNLSTDNKTSNVFTTVGGLDLSTKPTLSFGGVSGSSSSVLFGQAKSTPVATTSSQSIVKTIPDLAPSVSSSQNVPESEPLQVPTTATKSPLTSSSTTVASSPVGSTFGFATPVATSTQTTSSASSIGGLFSSSVTTPAPTSSAPSSIFGGIAATPLTTTPPASTAATGIFGTATPASTTVPSLGSGKLLGDAISTASPAPAPFATPTTKGLFSSPAPAVTTTAASTPPVGLFGSPSTTTSFLSTTATTAPAADTLPATGFMSSLNISSTSKPAATQPTTTAGGLFSSPSFGTATSTTGSIFGGSGNVFASQAASSFGGGGFSSPKPGGASVFGGATTSASVFGGAPAFGSTSPFGSSFGTSTASAFGGGGSIFGSAATAASTSQSTFGGLAQQSSTTPAFGGSPFGGSGQQTSVFGSSQQKQPNTTGGLFSSSFGGSVATTAGSIFGGGASSTFGGSTTAGPFTSNAGGVAQQGFGGFGQPKTPAASGSVFGSPSPSSPGAAAPVFGGGATFGSSSPFGSSFSAQPASATFGSPGGSVFGGAAAAQPTAGFGALAQQATATPGFGSPPTGLFGGVNQSPPQQTGSIFGSSAGVQQQSAPTFGGQAFSSWR